MKLSPAILEAIAQAQTIKARPDYDMLPQDVKDWCEKILQGSRTWHRPY